MTVVGQSAFASFATTEAGNEIDPTVKARPEMTGHGEPDQQAGRAEPLRSAVLPEAFLLAFFILTGPCLEPALPTPECRR